MKLAIMQPYFLPYIGYFQLIGAVDTFIVYDNIKYTKKGWINRNRYLRDGTDEMFSLALRKDPDSLPISERALTSEFSRDKLLNKFRAAYARAPQFAPTMAVLEDIVHCAESNLFDYLHNSIVKVCKHLELKTQILVSSEINIDHSLKGQEKVLALCQTMGARTYVNAIGGTELYARADFASLGVDLKFIQSKPFEYAQFDAPFVPWLSIVDVMMFNTPEKTCAGVHNGYQLV
jgi:hypothetical protein